MKLSICIGVSIPRHANNHYTVRLRTGLAISCQPTLKIGWHTTITEKIYIFVSGYQCYCMGLRKIKINTLPPPKKNLFLTTLLNYGAWKICNPTLPLPGKNLTTVHGA